MAKKTTKIYDDYGLLRVATAIPTVKVADVEYNLKQHIQLIREAHDEGVQVLAFPELSLTGYTCADLFHHESLLNAAREGLKHLAEATRGIDMAVIVGSPLSYRNRLYNCAVLLGDGNIVGMPVFVQKQRVNGEHFRHINPKIGKSGSSLDQIHQDLQSVLMIGR